jgi:hypothetical protein
MNLTGFNVRYFSNTKQLSFLLENFQCNAVETFTNGLETGSNPKEMRFGFTGVTGNTGWYFSVRNGKIRDPEGRIFWGLNEDETITISGNVGTGTYDYYVDNELICAIGARSAFDINGWFIEGVSGATGTATNIIVNGPAITATLNFSNNFVSGSTWTGAFSHNNNGPLLIRSGLLRMVDSNQFAISGSGLDFNTGSNVVASGSTRLIALNHTGLTSRTGLYIVGITIYTDFGPADFIVSGSGLPPSNNLVSNNLYSDTTGDIIATGSGISGTKYWFYNSVATDLSGNPLTKPIYLELSYLSGATGSFSLVTGYQITSSGHNYSGTVSVFVSPTGGGYPIASGTGIISGANSGITGLTWLTSGYYTGATGGYTITFSGVTGTLASGKPLFARLTLNHSRVSFNS